MTTFHCDKLCVNACCAWLRARLIAAKLRDEGVDVDGNAVYRRELLIERGHDAAKLESSAANCAIVDAMILDPAKLAELMASALRARGFWTRTELSHDGAYVPELREVVQTIAHYLVFADYEGNNEEHELGCCIPDICEHHVINVYDGSLSYARAKLLTIMQTSPDPSSRVTCERILRGNNGAPFALDAWPNEDERDAS